MVNILLVSPGVLSKFFEERVVVEKVKSPIVIRLDGVGFGKALKDKPLRDQFVHKALIEGCRKLMLFFNADFCHVVSDEVNLYMFKDLPYGGRVFKILSISSAILSSSVSLNLGRELYFDARIILLNKHSLAIPYLLYRARVGYNNYVSKLYSTLVSKELSKLNTMINNLASKGIKIPLDWRSTGSCLFFDTIDKNGFNPITKESVVVKRRIVRYSDSIELCLDTLLKIVKNHT